MGPGIEIKRVRFSGGFSLRVVYIWDYIGINSTPKRLKVGYPLYYEVMKPEITCHMRKHRTTMPFTQNHATIASVTILRWGGPITGLDVLAQVFCAS